MSELTIQNRSVTVRILSGKIILYPAPISIDTSKLHPNTGETQER